MTAPSGAPARPPGLWSVIAGVGLASDEPDPARERALAERLALLTDAAFAAWLLAGEPLLLETPFFSSERVQRARLFNRFARTRALFWLGYLAEREIEAVCLKGFASAHMFYPDPDLRDMTDVDLLVRARDLPRVVATLRDAGFVFRKSRMPVWGMIGDASFQPFVSADGHTNFDLHIHPDDYPLHLGLSTDDVFASARTVPAGDGAIRVPQPSHFFLIALANAVRDKFGPGCLNSLLDAVVLLTREPVVPVNLDWSEIERRAERARFRKGLATSVALLARLGVPSDRLPDSSRRSMGALARRVFESVVRDLGEFFPRPPGFGTMLAREALLCADPTTVLRRNARRFTGLFRARRGVPPPASSALDENEPLGREAI